MTQGTLVLEQRRNTLQREKDIADTANKYRKRLLGFVKNRVSNLDDAEDLVQDVLLQFINSYDLVDPIRNAGSWLFTVARNKIVDFYRKKRPAAFSHMGGAGGESETDSLGDQLQRPGSTGNPHDELLKTSLWDALYLALEEMPPAQRDVFVAHELEGKSFSEISEESGINKNTLLSRKRYAVQFLRSRLAGFQEEIIT